MFKLLGFMLGSAISIAAIVMLLGMPEFHWSKLTDDSDRFDAAVEKLKEKREQAEKLVAAANEAARRLETETPPAGDAPTPPADDPEPRENPDEDAAPPAETEDAEAEPPAEPAHTLPLDDIVADASWYAFWNPFRSELAARGFVSQLEKVTGLDYRIVKVKAGVYQVAFAYADDAERDLRLSQIQAATGLDLSGAQR